MKKIAMFLILATAVGFTPAWAFNTPIGEGLAKLADHNSYAVKAPGMLMYGLYEIGEAPLELVSQPIDQTITKKDYAFGLFKGINKGAFNLLKGATQGTFDVLRALVPGVGRYEGKGKQTRLLPGLAA